MVINLRKFAKVAKAVRGRESMRGRLCECGSGPSGTVYGGIIPAPRHGGGKIMRMMARCGGLAFAAALFGGVGAANATLLNCGINSCTFTGSVTNNGTINIPLFLTTNGAPVGMSLTSLSGTVTPSETAISVTIANDGSSPIGSVVTGGKMTSTGNVQLSDSLDVASTLTGSRYSGLSGTFVPSNSFSYTFSGLHLTPGQSSTHTFSSLDNFNLGTPGSYIASDLSQWETIANGTVDPLAVSFVDAATGTVTSTGNPNQLSGAQNSGGVSVSFTYNFAPTQVPEPATLAMLMSGVLGLGAVRFRRRRR